MEILPEARIPQLVEVSFYYKGHGGINVLAERPLKAPGLDLFDDPPIGQLQEKKESSGLSPAETKETSCAGECVK